MPAIPVTLGTQDQCVQCDVKPPEGSKLMKCSKCKIARYCSVECQKAAWKTHKKECMDHYEEMKDTNNPALPILKPFMQWGDVWFRSFFVWGFLAGADRFRQDNGFFRKNCFVLRMIEPTGKPLRKSRIGSSFKYYSSSFMTDAQIKRDLYKTYMITEDLQRNFENMPASEWNLRIVILLEQGHGLFMLHHNPFALILEKEYNNPVDAQMVVASVLMPGPQGVMFAKKLQDGYEQRLTKDLDTGNAKGFMEYIQQLQAQFFPTIDLRNAAS